VKSLSVGNPVSFVAENSIVNVYSARMEHVNVICYFRCQELA